MEQSEYIEHLNNVSKNILKLEILILNVIDELEKQGFISAKEIIENANAEYDETISKVKLQVEEKLEEIKKDFVYSSLYYGNPGEA